MNTILDRIIARNRENFDRSPSRRRELEKMAAVRPRPYHSFATALSAPRLNIIAELKKASPSKGVIREDFPVSALAAQLAGAGAAALSVLTEPYYFQGSPEYLRAAAAVQIPLLRKDFIFDELQILEAVVLGADAVLLIAAALERAQMKDFHQFAKSLKLDTLCEIHDEHELDMVMDFNPDIIGVNCRDLKTFTIDHNLTRRLLADIPSPKVKVAESGIRNHADLVNLRNAGADAFLVGETLMRTPHPGNALRELLHEN